MNIESLIDRIVKENDTTDYEQLFDQMIKMKLYFFVIDDGSFSSVDEIVFSGKDRPITIPAIQEGDKKSAVLYTSKEVALKYIQKGFRVSHTLKGIDALKFLYDGKGVNEIILQGNGGHIILSKSLVKKLINSII